LLAGVIVLLVALALVLMRYFDSLHQRAKDLALAGTVFQSSQQGIIVTNSRGDIVRVNPAYCRITGYSEAELLGKNPRILKSGLQDAEFYQTMWASLKDERTLAGRNQEPAQERRVLRAVGEHRCNQRRSGRRSVCRHRFRYFGTGRLT
jgi:PAS domain S-box-containing protein